MRLQATLESRGKLVRQLRANAERPFSRGRKRGEVMDSEQKAIAEFASRSKVVIEIYGDQYGKSIRARYQDDGGIEHGCVILLGSKRQSDGLPHTIGSATEEAIQRLLEAAT
jgi:hypothetical protein